MYLVVGKNPFKGIVQPVPEPHEYALMALGLFMIWRRMQTA
jgi:hypothetical protein